MSIEFNLYRSGNSLLGTNPSGAASTSGGTPALAWSAPSGLVNGETITITTDGTYDFGGVGPQFILLIDTYNAQGTHLTLANDIEVGEGVTFDNYADGFELENTDLLGRAIKMGSTETGNGTATQGRIWLDFPAHPRMYECRATYWPAANQANAVPFLDGGNTWQLKNVWKMADRDFVATDTDFFVAGEGYAFYNPTVKFKSQGGTLSTNSIQTIYMNGTGLNDATDLYNRPYPEPHYFETLCDQKNYDGVTADNEVDFRSTRAGIGTQNRIQRDDLILAVPSAPTRVINSLSYPGYVRGFSIPDSANFYEADLYFANGEGAACRAMISDHADLFQSSKFAPMRPLSWANNQASFKFRTGIFQSDLSGCYINLIGADNVQIGSMAL